MNTKIDKRKFNAGQPKKADSQKRTNQMRMVFNDSEKSIFDNCGFTKTHLLRKFLTLLSDANGNQKDLVLKLIKQLEREKIR
jgi:ABC-type dipeptide/oligopeptide/nickel transport system ATPase subunit